MSQDNFVLRFSAAGGVPERLGRVPDKLAALVLVLPDGRPLLFTAAGFKPRFQIVQPDGSLTPLIESGEDYGTPAALAGEGEVAVTADRNPPEIAIVSIADGRIVRRVPVQAQGIGSLASSPDGATFYFTSEGFVWSMPAAGGAPVKLVPGDGVSADARGRELIVSLQDMNAIRLERVPLDGGAPQPIPLPRDVSIPGTKLASMDGPEGQIAIPIASPSEWEWRIGIVQPLTAKFTLVPVKFDGDSEAPVWTRDGKLVAMGMTMGFNIWRFHQSK